MLQNKTRINSHMENAGWLSQSGLDDVEECSSTGFKLMRLGHDRAGVDSVGGGTILKRHRSLLALGRLKRVWHDFEHSFARPCHSIPAKRSR